MKNQNEREEILHLEDLYCLCQDKISAVTIDLQLWHYHIYRVLLRFTEGHYASLEEIDNAIGDRYAGTAQKIQQNILQLSVHLEIFYVLRKP